ncbi:molybdopterin-synthase adenylyltransferase MoeB [Rubricoccus marinus]|uniref:Molybdopterin-synthase adenylyltransferase n=1 Tax=Rubricoccus marinus TaxID=716817 RepID=A0A259TYD4_9BACT|nr:molybdopterin-synthase adenylyltransferase MoeB [Rubricoccus marinus]OZC02783.1 hypothetical protein BSZ36_07230 [Rubricoccus marinus]
MSTFSARELERYSRQTRLPQIGLSGQQTLREASVLIVGAGGLGSPAALYLAASGVGRLGLVDDDAVDRSNLHRQVLYGESDVGVGKAEAAARRLRDMNPEVDIVVHAERFDASNADHLVSGYDVVLDGTDTFATRYLINDACVLNETVNVSASVSSFSGQLFIRTNNGPCYRCLYPEPPPEALAPSCAEAGVLGVVPGVLGMLQATEATKWILGVGDPLEGRLLIADLLTMRFRDILVDRDPDCPVCGHSPTIRSLDDASTLDTAACTPQMPTPTLTVQDLKTRLDAGEDVFLLDVRSRDEHAFADIGGAIIPLPELSNRWDELDPYADRALVVYCKSGGRSGVAVSMLQSRGFDALSLEGGIDAWSEEIDPSVPRY